MSMRLIMRLSAPALALAALSACSQGEPTAEKPIEQPAAAPATTAAASQTAAYASLTGDAAKGEKIFVQCRSCHVLDAGVNRIGPSLHNVVGRASGSVAGYSYSPANKTIGLTWDEETLFGYLAAPRTVVPGTKMAFAGLAQPQDRADLIAYLKTSK